MDEKYEDRVADIDELLQKHRVKWRLDAIAWMDYDDVCQIIRLHIFKKWHLWDQSRSFKPWVATLIANQIRNLVRNNYFNYARPCLRCPHNMGSDGCNLTKSGTQDSSCEIFAKWQKKKETAYNLKLPVQMESAAFCMSEDQIITEEDFEEGAKKLHKLVMDQLGIKHREIYFMLFIENKTDEEVADRFGFKEDTCKRKKARYKQIANLRKKFYELATETIKNNDVI
jgi:RNA polymerase sigma factor (sigma-70 family)